MLQILLFHAETCPLSRDATSVGNALRNGNARGSPSRPRGGGLQVTGQRALSRSLSVRRAKGSDLSDRVTGLVPRKVAACPTCVADRSSTRLSYCSVIRPRTKPSGTFGNSKIDGLNFARLEEKMIRTGKKKVPSGKKSLSSVRNFLARNPRKTPIFFLTRRSEFILPVLLWFSRCIFCTVLKGACLRGHGVPGRPRIATS